MRGMQGGRSRRVTPTAEVQDREPAPKQSIAAGASWLMISKTISSAITLLMPFVLFRCLTKVERGYYSQLFMILQSGGTLLPIGMQMTLFYFIPRAQTRREKGNIVLGVMLFCAVSAGLAGAGIALFPDALQWLLNDGPWRALAPQMGLALVPYVVTSLLEYILVSNGETRMLAIMIVTVNLVRVPLIIGAALIWGNVQAILWSVDLYLVFQSIWLFAYLFKRFGKFWEGFSWGPFASQLSYGLPLGVSGLLSTLYLYIDNVYVTHFYGATLLAVYAAGCFDVPLVGILSESVGSTMIPRISALQATNSIAEIKSLTVKAMRAMAFAYAPIFFFLSMAAGQVITGLARKDYADSIPIFRISLFMVLLSIVTVDPVVRAFKSERFWVLRLTATLFVLLNAVLLFAINRFGTAQFQLTGIIACMVAVQYVTRFFLVWRMSNLLKVGWSDLRPLRDVLKTIAAAGVAGIGIVPLLPLVENGVSPQAGAFLGKVSSLAVCGTVFVAIYITLLLFLKAPSRSEIQWCLTRIDTVKKIIPGLA